MRDLLLLGRRVLHDRDGLRQEGGVAEEGEHLAQVHIEPRILRREQRREPRDQLRREPRRDGVHLLRRAAEAAEARGSNRAPRSRDRVPSASRSRCDPSAASTGGSRLLSPFPARHSAISAVSAARGSFSASALSFHVSTGWCSIAMRAAKRMKRSSWPRYGQANSTAFGSCLP